MESSPDDHDDEPAPPDADRPLLIESVPGEPKEPVVAGIGQAMVFLGGITILAYILLAIIAGPSLTRDWGGVWYRPGPQVDFLPVVALLVLFAGLALYMVGRGRGRR